MMNKQDPIFDFIHVDRISTWGCEPWHMAKLGLNKNIVDYI